MNKNILIVEYDIKTIDEIKDAFPYSSIKFTIAEDGLKAKEVLETNNFDLVITAAMLPKFHGFQLSEFIAKKYSNIKIIIISGIYKGIDYRHQAITQFKADDFFEKPLEIELLKEKIIELLNIDSEDLILTNSSVDKKTLTDTAKIPTYEKLKEEEKKLTSDDIFGDIIKDVEQSKPENDILANSLLNEPQVSKKERSISKTVEIDLSSLDDLLKKPIKKKVIKKIEDDISKKLEDTLSGLGLSNNKPKKKIIPKENIEPQIMEIEKKKSVESKNEEKYDILGLIARGGMAEIYKAKKKGVKGFKKIIALKKILSGYGEDDKFIEMFVDEAKIAAELTHPNIVQIYDFEKRDDTYLIAMEFVQGKDLRNILKETNDKDKKIPEELSLYIISMILEALSYAHSAKDDIGNDLNIVHRDVSPPNILISYNGEVKLTDFGVSKASNKMHQTISGALKGKLSYMAPEQARGERDINSRADLYSVGVILFELLTGRKLFIDNSEMAILKKVQEGTIVNPSEVYTDIDPELERILLKSLSKSLEDRYQSADEMIGDMEKYISATYKNIPGSVHLSHYIYSLFKDEILKENIQIELKPTPSLIEKIVKPIEPPTESIQNFETEVIDLGFPIDQPELFEEEDEYKNEISNEIETPDKIEIPDVVETPNEVEISNDKLTNIDDFDPAIDINLSISEQELQEPEIKEPTMTLEEIEKQLQDQNKIDLVEDIPNKKSKKSLLIAAIIIIIVLAAVYFAISSGLFSKKSNEPKGPVILQLSETNLINNLVHEKGEDIPLTGFIESKWENTNIKEKTEYKSGIKNGYYKKYFNNNRIEEEGVFLEGKKNNKWTTYNKNNNKIYEVTYKSGKKNGPEKIWNNSNNIISSKTYLNGIEITGKTFLYFPDNKNIKEEILLKNGIETYKKIWDVDGNRLIKGLITNKSKQNKLKIGNRTGISFEINDTEFLTLPKETLGSVIGINDPAILFKIEISDSEKNRAKVIDISEKKRSIIIEKDKVFIIFTIIKKIIETDPKVIAANIKKVEEEKLAEEKKAEKEKKAEEEKQKRKIAAEKKAEEEKLTKEKKAEEEKIRIAEEEKKKKELEDENKRIEQAKLAKQEEDKKKNALKEGDLVTDVDTPPVPIETLLPKLSKKLRRKMKGESIRLTLSLLINENGSVEKIKRLIKSGIPEIDVEIISWVNKNWKFKPAIKYNKKVKTWITKVIKLNK